MQKGRSFVEQGQLQEAVRVCRLGLLANPGEIEGRLVLGSALMALARYDEVLAEMQSALAMERMNPSALALKGEALLRKGEAVQALAVLEQASQVALGDPYVEALQAEAAAAALSAPAPYETVDIDPELEGVEIHEERTEFAPPLGQLALAPALDPALNPSLNPAANLGPGASSIARPNTPISGSELLDSDLLDEATPTPVPDNLDDDMMTTEAPRGLVERLDSIERLDSVDLEEVEQPFEDQWGQQSTELPTKAEKAHQEPARRQMGIPGRPETVGTLFPEDESGVSGLELVASPHAAYEAPPIEVSDGSGIPRAMTADMDLIRGGFEHEQGRPAPMPRAMAPRAVSIANEAPLEPRRDPGLVPPKRRRRVPAAVWGVLLVGAVGGGFVGGLEIRKQRLAGQVMQAQADAKSYAAGDSYLGYKQARDLYGRVDKLEHNDASKSALARAEAALAAEFGHSPEQGAKLLAQVGNKSELDALIAAGYLAIAKGDHVDAMEKAALITGLSADEAVGHYLMGRAKILSERPKEALLSIDKALKLDPGPLAYVAQARAEAQQGHYAAALEAVARANEGDAENAAALIWQARILLRAGELPRNPSDPDDKLRELIELSRSRTLNSNSLSPAQGAWAGLVLADIKLHRGDSAQADVALAEAKVNRPTDWLFAETLADILVRLGKYKEAKEEATRASQLWPNRAKPRIVLALVALLDGNPDSAIDILDEVDGVDSLVDALVVRGRANLKLGLLDKAVADLDKALAERSRNTDAIIARAKVDILRGDAKSAISRLEPMYDRTASPDLAIAYATALRVRGKSAQARSVLEPQAGEDGTTAALIELAALERSEGHYKEARAAFQRAISLDAKSQEARLGAALLDIEDGRIDEGRRGLDALVSEGTENGQILVEAARAQTWTGGAESSAILLERAAKSSSWLNWKVARETGRIHLRKQDVNNALVDLLRAQSLRPSDPDTRLLIMETHLVARNKKGSSSTLEEITKSFRSSPIRPLAAGMHALLLDKAPEAQAAFTQARSVLVDAKASRLELARVEFWLGRSYELAGNLKESENWLKHAIELNGSHAAAYFWLGQVQVREGKVKQMAANYQKAMAIDPTYNAMAWYFLGSYYAENGNKELAAKSLESFLEFYHEDSGDLVIEAKALLEQVR